MLAAIHHGGAGDFPAARWPLRNNNDVEHETSGFGLLLLEWFEEQTACWY